MGPILTPVSPADGQREGEWDVIQPFALLAQSLQMGVIPARAQAGKDANLASHATVAGVCCTCSEFRWSPPEQHQMTSSINKEVP